MHAAGVPLQAPRGTTAHAGLAHRHAALAHNLSSANALVAHLEEGLEVVHMYTGMCNCCLGRGEDALQLGRARVDQANAVHQCCSAVRCNADGAGVPQSKGTPSRGPLIAALQAARFASCTWRRVPCMLTSTRMAWWSMLR
jgi:hypothetical protein